MCLWAGHLDGRTGRKRKSIRGFIPKHTLHSENISKVSEVNEMIAPRLSPRTARDTCQDRFGENIFVGEIHAGAERAYEEQ
jgi:hypothetical protein